MTSLRRAARLATACLVLACLAGIGFGAPKVAAVEPSMTMEVEVCLCQELLARYLCKNVAEFELLGRRLDMAYVFNVFYANKKTNFICSVAQNMVRVEGPELVRKRSAMLFEYDADVGCAVGWHDNPQCLLFSPEIRCCKEGAQEEQQRKLEEQFWDRPTPKDLPTPDISDQEQSEQEPSGQGGEAGAEEEAPAGQ